VFVQIDDSLETSDDNMAISNAEQFGLLLWKNWLLQKRRIVVTTFQILLPALFALILLLLRMIVDSEFISTPKIWDSFDASTLPPKLTRPKFNCSSVNASTLDLIKFNCSSFNVSTLPPKLTPPEFNCSSVNASTLDLIKFNCSSFNVSTLPTNMTEPSQAGDMRWMLVYSPNTSQAAKRMAQVVTRMLDITPVPIGTVHHYLLMLLTITDLTCEVSFIFSEVTKVTRCSQSRQNVLRLDLVISDANIRTIFPYER